MSDMVRIAITPGEPAGIGPELALKLSQQPLDYEIVAIANMQMLQQQSEQLGLGVKLEPFDINTDNESHHPGQLKVIDVVMPKQFEFGKLDAANSSYVIETLNTAVNLVQSNTLQAITTGPVQKSIINEAGITFSGHTEFIADKTGGHPVMLLANENLDVKTNSYYV